MSTTEFVLKLISWTTDNPWLGLLVFAAVGGLVVFVLGRLFHWVGGGGSGHYYYDDRGMARCLICTDGARTNHKVVYFDEASAQVAANHLQARFGAQRVYRDNRCGFWHLTSQERRQVRGSRS